MIKINLAPSVKKAKAPKPKAPKLAIKLPAIKTTVFYMLGIGAVVVIIALVLIIQSSRIAGLNSNLKGLNAKLDELKVYVMTVDSLKIRERQLMALIHPIKELNRNRFLIARIIDEISTRIPEFTWLTSLDIDSIKIGIKGTTASNLLVADFMNSLEDSPYISHVDLTVLEKKTIQKQEMMEFTLTADVVRVTSTGGEK